MKIKLFILTIIAILGTQNGFAQTEKRVTEIRNEVNLINKNAKKYKKSVKVVEDISLEGTEATFFVSGKGLKKITAKIYGETFNASAEFFYQGEQLIFAYYKMNRYDTQIGLEKPPKVVSVEEKRFYFTDETVIKLLVGKTNVKKKSKQWENSVEEIRDLESKLKAAYQN